MTHRIASESDDLTTKPRLLSMYVRVRVYARLCVLYRNYNQRHYINKYIVLGRKKDGGYTSMFTALSLLVFLDLNSPIIMVFKPCFPTLVLNDSAHSPPDGDVSKVVLHTKP